MAKRPEQAADLSLFHTWLGACVARWAVLESKVFDTCHLAMACDREIAAIAFYSLNSLHQKLALTDSAMIHRLRPAPREPGRHDTSELQEWSKIKNRIGEQLVMRNFLVHQPSGVSLEMLNKLTVREALTSAEAWANATVILQQPDDKKRRDLKIKPIGLSSLKEHYQIVAWLVTDLSRYVPSLHHALHGWPSPLSGEEIRRNVAKNGTKPKAKA